MRFTVAGGRGLLVRNDRVADVEEWSQGALPSDPTLLIAKHWDRLRELAEASAVGGTPLQDVVFDPPVPQPPLVLAVIANYPPSTRAAFPMIVGKAPTALVGPTSDIVLPDGGSLPLGQAFVIPEPELAVVTSAAGRHLSDEEASHAILGYTVAQDITERHHEFGAARPPWSWDDLPAKTLGKSFDTFLPMGPAVVTPDETGSDSLDKRCWINGELTYEQHHADMLWSPAQLVALVSRFMSLRAGTVILCGSGPRLDGQPPVGLVAGDVIRTEIAGLGVIENTCVGDVERSIPDSPAAPGSTQQVLGRALTSDE